MMKIYQPFIVSLILSMFLPKANAQKISVEPADKLNRKLTSTLSFRENKGQLRDQNGFPRPDILFSVESAGMICHLDAQGLHYQLNKINSWQENDTSNINPFNHRNVEKKRKRPDKISIHRVDVEWIDCDSKCLIEKSDELPGYDNFYNVSTGQAPALFVKSYGSITYKNIYPGIDLRFYKGSHGGLEYDFILAPGADYKNIKMKVKGAELSVKGEQLIFKTPFGEIREGALKVYQGNKEIKSQWKLENNEVSFILGDYILSNTLRIDPPVLVWGTYYGSSENEDGHSCALDLANNVYLAGETESMAAIATIGAHQTTINGYSDAFLAKFNPGGTRMWATYYGGAYSDIAYTCCTSSVNEGFVYIGGSTVSSTNIATPGVFQSSFPGYKTEAFLVKFNLDGIRQWGTYFGFTGHQIIYSSCADEHGNVYVSGMTSGTGPGSTILSTPMAHQVGFGGTYDVFLAKFNETGNRIWSTYYGAELWDNCSSNSLCIDQNDFVYLAGDSQPYTNPAAIATVGAHQSTTGGDLFDGSAFLVKFDSSGTRIWGTFYGGINGEIGTGCSVDPISNDVYLTGYTFSDTGIATPGAHKVTYTGLSMGEAFLAKFNAGGTRLWGTYYGDSTYSRNCTVDQLGNVYITGETFSPTSVATPGAHQTYLDFYQDAFLAQFSSGGSLISGTYYGGDSVDKARCLVINPTGDIYIAGNTKSTTGIATTGAHQTVNGGSVWYLTGDAFLAKFNTTLSTNEELVQPQFSIYPQPATEFFYVKFNDVYFGNKTWLELVDANGKHIYGVECIPQKGNDIYVPLANLETGMYILSIKADTKKESVQILKE